MKITNAFRNHFVTITAYLFVFLFVYAAVSKILDFESFQAQLSQSPLISVFTGIVSFSVPFLELLISLLLVFPKTRSVGLITFFGMIASFTFYIFFILNYASFIPCSCGGILDDLGWREHLFFNLVFLVLSGSSFLMVSKNTKSGILQLSGILVISVLSIFFLHQYSESIIYRNHPFIRTFVQGSIYKDTMVSLPLKSHYFAGHDEEFIYVANSQSPLHIIAIDSTLQKRNEFTIQLERTDFPFSNVQVRVVPPYFYVFDGSVPVVFKGLISDWKCKVVMHENGYYFSKAEVIDSNRIAFRAQGKETFEHILGLITLDSIPELRYSKTKLEKQFDGIFDTDGMMKYDRHSNNLIYLYYYRNSYLVTDHNLDFLNNGRTIDTTTLAKIQVYQDKRTGEKRLISPYATVNQQLAFAHSTLFVQSKLIGKFEPKDMWKESSIVDVYRSQTGDYLSSLYVHHIDGFKLQDMQIYHNQFYTIIGPYLVKYNFNSVLKSKIYTDQ